MKYERGFFVEGRQTPSLEFYTMKPVLRGIQGMKFEC